MTTQHQASPISTSLTRERLMTAAERIYDYLALRPEDGERYGESDYAITVFGTL